MQPHRNLHRRAGQTTRQPGFQDRELASRDPINQEWKETLVQGLLARAAHAGAPGMPPKVPAKVGEDALAEALGIAQAAAAAPAHNVHWPGLLADVHAALAGAARARGDRRAAAASWQAVRAALEPLAKAGRLSAQRKAQLDRARAGG